MVNGRFSLLERFSGYTQKCLVFVNCILPAGTFISLIEFFKTSLILQISALRLYLDHLYFYMVLHLKQFHAVLQCSLCVDWEFSNVISVLALFWKSVVALFHHLLVVLGSLVKLEQR